MLDRINDWYLRLFVWLDTWPWWAHFLVVPGFLVALVLVAGTAALIWIYASAYVARRASFAACAVASLVLWAGVAYGVWRIPRRARLRGTDMSKKETIFMLLWLACPILVLLGALAPLLLHYFSNSHWDTTGPHAR